MAKNNGFRAYAARQKGKSLNFIAFDELTHFTQEQYEYMKSRNRAQGTAVPCSSRPRWRRSTPPAGKNGGSDNKRAPAANAVVG